MRLQSHLLQISGVSSDPSARKSQLGTQSGRIPVRRYFAQSTAVQIARSLQMSKRHSILSSTLLHLEETPKGLYHYQQDVGLQVASGNIWRRSCGCIAHPCTATISANRCTHLRSCSSIQGQRFCDFVQANLTCSLPTGSRHRVRHDPQCSKSAGTHWNLCSRMS